MDDPAANLTMRRIEGLTCLESSTRAGRDCQQEVLIRDREGAVYLEMGNTTYGAKLTPDQARFLSMLLEQAANRVDGQTAEPGGAR